MNKNQHETDKAFMNKALLLAYEQLGQVWPNPAVGCLLVKNGHIIAQGVTGKGGRPHGEQQALLIAGQKAQGATAYVSLEPCAHEGKTPSCAKALIKAGVARVVYACTDPDPRVSGQGGNLLREAGLLVESGLLRDDAKELNQGFFLKIQENRPLVHLKIASSKDGKIFDPNAEERWITGETSRDRGHEMRAQHDAILVGINTVLADDPMLTCRLHGLEDYSPVRIVLDSKYRIPLDSQLVKSVKNFPLWVVGRGAPPKALTERGVRVLRCDDIYKVRPLLNLLASEGITRLMVEGGARINSSFLRSGLVDFVSWFQAPHEIGDEGLNALIGAKLHKILQSSTYECIKEENLDKDTLAMFKRAR